jgi:hypothetical protein
MVSFSAQILQPCECDPLEFRAQQFRYCSHILSCRLSSSSSFYTVLRRLCCDTSESIQSDTLYETHGVNFELVP